MPPRKNLLPGQGSNPKGRGLAKPTAKWGKERLIIIWNNYGQPVGGEMAQLATQIGIFAKNGEHFPLTNEWSQMNHECIHNVWNDVLENTNAPPEYFPVMALSLAKAWRDWKYNLKQHYKMYQSDEDALAHPPRGCVADQWAALVAMWGTPKAREISETNKLNREKQSCLNRTGKTSHPKVIKERGDKGLPTDRVSVFIHTRTGKTPADQATTQMIQTLNDAVEELPEDSPAAREDVFVGMFGSDDHGRVRCMGGGLNKTKVFGKSQPSQAAVAEAVAGVKADFERQLEEERRKNEDERLKLQQQIDELKRWMERRGNDGNE